VIFIFVEAYVHFQNLV